MTNRFCGFILGACVLLLPLRAHAASGWVTGTWLYFNNLGNYCDVPAGQPGDKNGSGNQTCTGAGHTRYPESQYQVSAPIANSKLYVKSCPTSSSLLSCSTVIGVGNTTLGGGFNIAWNSASTPAFVRVFWQLEDKDNRFSVRDADGDPFTYWSSAVTVQNGISTAMGDINVGISVASASGLANIYGGAYRMWYDSLEDSDRMVNLFTGLVIRAYPTDCPTACALGPSNRIHMPTGSDFSPQGRILHEMGHIASYITNPRRTNSGSYCYPSTSLGVTCPVAADSGWGWTTNEWRGVAQEEGFATFLGDRSLYRTAHEDPRSCLSSNSCGTSVETGPSSCSGTMGRRALQVTRYLRDVYDSTNDAETVTAPMYSFLDTWGAVPNGYAWGQDESAFVNSGSTVDDWDAFHPWEWRNAMLVHYSGAIDIQVPYSNNCMGWF